MATRHPRRDPLPVLASISRDGHVPLDMVLDGAYVVAETAPLHEVLTQ